LRFAVVPPEDCPAATPDEVHVAAVAAGDWLERNLDTGGRFVYGYHLDTDLVNPAYNIVRHAGAVNSLYQLVADGEDRFLPAADLALGYLLDFVIEHDDWKAIAEHGARAKLGTVGFAVVALAQRRAITGDMSNDDLMRGLGRFILVQQEPSGAILAYWDPRTEAAMPGEYGKFATGEAVWALVVLEDTFPGEGWWEGAEPALRYIADGTREVEEGHRARLPDHWAAYALEAAGSDRLDDELVAYAERLAGYFSLRLRLEAQRSGEMPNVLIRGYPGPPSGVGTAAEGMAALYRLAEGDSRLEELRPDMLERMTCNAGTMVHRQVDAVDAAAEPDPGLAEGAWFYRSYTQVDDQQHVISGLLGAEGAMREDSQ